MKELFIFILMIISPYFLVNCVEIKNADVVFKKWLEMQERYSVDASLQETAKLINDALFTNFRKKYEEEIFVFRAIYPFLNIVTDGCVNEYGHEFRAPISANFIKNLSMIYFLIEHDMPGFIKFLETTGFSSAQNVQNEQYWDSTDIILKNNLLINLLFAVQNERKREELAFGVANRFFEYCFSAETFCDFQRLLLDKNLYPITRMLYSVIWYNLAGCGWKNWCFESLKVLKERFADGHQIVYIAGGSDIYQLIKAGIYNIKVIDPQLPSQPKYYADEWSWIISGAGIDSGIGDKIIFNNAGKKIIMERVDFQVDGTTFDARIATGQIITLPHSISTWNILDEKGSKLGTYILDRRFVSQDDFIPRDKTTFLMSFNELFYITLPDFMGGWGIEPSKFQEGLEIVVKQLHRPVTKQMLYNMRMANLLNTSDFKFISLGTCIN